MAEPGGGSTDFEDLDGWVAATLPRAVAYASSLLKDRGLADDVVHDCYCRLLRKAGDYDLLRDGTRLLFRSVTHACINFNRRERPHASLDLRARGGSRDPGIEDRRMTAPGQPLLDRELEAQIQQGLAGLPIAQRAAIELQSLGHSRREIAEALETSPANAGVLIHRARRALASRLASYLGEPSR